MATLDRVDGLDGKLSTEHSKCLQFVFRPIASLHESWTASAMTCIQLNEHNRLGTLLCGMIGRDITGLIRKPVDETFELSSGIGKASTFLKVVSATRVADVKGDRWPPYTLDRSTECSATYPGPHNPVTEKLVVIDINAEQLISLRQVPNYLPRRPNGRKIHISAVYRWVQRGCGGKQLEAIKIGGTTYTSKEALQRFGVTANSATAAVSESPVVRTERAERARRAVECLLYPRRHNATG